MLLSEPPRVFALWVLPTVFSLQQIDILRTAEIEKIAGFLTPGARVLEIGAGTGKQAEELQRRGFDVAAIEIPSSNYAANRIFPIIDYDGRTIPLTRASTSCSRQTCSSTCPISPG
jgi:SAM-dependent methyltransferase